jgi:hypothetical protein
LREPLTEIGLGVDARDGTDNALGLERFPNDVRVGIVVFKMKKAQRCVHGYLFLTLPGGGSLMTAQNTPSSLMASTN